jgi:hypothetical protein
MAYQTILKRDPPAKRSGAGCSLCFVPPSRRRPSRELANGSRDRRPAADRRDCQSPPTRSGSDLTAALRAFSRRAGLRGAVPLL